jgi:hypothetical protein
VSRFLEHVVRWPLLIGATVCLVLGLAMATEAGDKRTAVVVLIVLGALLLGAWLWALATHTNPAARPADAGSSAALPDAAAGDTPAADPVLDDEPDSR